MKLDPVWGRRLATLGLFAFLGFILWRLAASRGNEGKEAQKAADGTAEGSRCHTRDNTSAGKNEN